MSFVKRGRCCISFYAFDFSPSAAVVAVEVASVAAGSAAHASEGNFANSAALYFGWLQKEENESQKNVFTALALAKRDPQMVNSGLILARLNIPAELITR